MSWAIVGALTLCYWALLFLRMRRQGRRDFDRAFKQAAAEHSDRDSFDVTVPMNVRPVRTAVVILAAPAVLVLIRLVVASGASSGSR